MGDTGVLRWPTVTSIYSFESDEWNDENRRLYDMRNGLKEGRGGGDGQISKLHAEQNILIISVGVI